mgnify:CR=1 FL=1
MNAAESVEFAKHVDPKDAMPDKIAENHVLWAVFHACPGKVKESVLKKFLDSVDAFRNPDNCPGGSVSHELWYPHHLQIAARAAQLIKGISS